MSHSEQESPLGDRGERARTEHVCHARNCDVPVPPKLFMCKRHWFMVPRVIRWEVWKYYVPGQEILKNPTPEYLAAANMAIRAVALQEGLR